MISRYKIDELCTNLINKIDLYLVHELPGQEKSFFSPKHSSEAEQLKLMLSLLRDNSKYRNINPNDKLDLILALLSGYVIKAEVSERVGFIELKSVIEQYKGGPRLAKALTDTMQDFDYEISFAKSRPQLK